jgi:hypothetical protein
MGNVAIEKQWPAVAPQAFTVDGNALGVVTVANTAGFKVKQQVIISATGLPDLTVKIYRFISPTSFRVGPVNPTAGLGLTGKTDISAYTVLLGAFIYAQEQPKVTIKPDDIWQAVYRQEPGTTIGVEIDDQWGNPINAANPLPVSIDSTIAIGDVSIVEGGNTMVVNPDGSINVQGNTTVSGTVNTNLNGLNAFQTSQYTVGITAIQLTPIPLVNRSSLSIKVIATSSSDMVYIGNSNAVTAGTGYFLFNGDTIQMDLTPLDQIYAIGTSPGQIVAVLEIGA